jgi:hypothetical protein
MALGQASFTSKVTQECELLSFWVVHFGDHNVAGGVQAMTEPETYRHMLEAISDSFSRVDIPEVVRLLDKRFEKTYSLRSLFRDEQRRILKVILSSTISEAEAAYLQFYEQHAPLMRFVTSLGTPTPREFSAAVEYAINSLLRRALSAEELDAERVQNLLDEAQASNVVLDKTTLEFSLRKRLEVLAVRFAADPSNLEKLADLRSALKVVKQLPFAVNLWMPQNQVYAIQGGLYQRSRRKAQRGDSKAQTWLNGYLELCDLLSIRIS